MCGPFAVLSAVLPPPVSLGSGSDISVWSGRVRFTQRPVERRGGGHSAGRQLSLSLRPADRRPGRGSLQCKQTHPITACQTERKKQRDPRERERVSGRRERRNPDRVTRRRPSSPPSLETLNRVSENAWASWAAKNVTAIPLVSKCRAPFPALDNSNLLMMLIKPSILDEI